MDEVYDFENNNNYDKTRKIVKRLKIIKLGEGEKKKISGKITQIIMPNEFIIKGTYGTHYGIVLNEETINKVYIDEYGRKLVNMTLKNGDDITIDIDFIINVMVKETTYFTYFKTPYKDKGLVLDYFIGLFR